MVEGEVGLKESKGFSSKATFSPTQNFYALRGGGGLSVNSSIGLSKRTTSLQQ